VNTQERNASDKTGSQRLRDDALPAAPVLADAGKPGILLRIAAAVLCSGVVLKRIHHPDVLALLGELARQAGRMDAVLKIQALTSARR
jgi:hypothetical protein